MFALVRFARTTAPTATNRLSALAAQRSMSAAAAPAVASTTDGPPSVFDKIVKITIIDPSGARRTIPAMVGQTLYAACDANGVDLGPASVGGPEKKTRSSTWEEPLYGEGPTSGFDHVLLQAGHDGLADVEAISPIEVKSLEDYWDEDELFPESRLASMVEINNKMDGLVVYVPDRIVDDIP